MSGTKIDVDNPKFKLTQEQILEIVDNLDCKASTKELLQKYYSQDIIVAKENVKYYDRIKAKFQPLIDDFYRCNVYLYHGDIVIDGQESERVLQEVLIRVLMII